MNGRIVVVDDVAAAFSQLIADTVAEQRRGSFSLAFSGGSTARSCYERLAADHGGSIDWSAFVGWWGDERCVPLDDDDSNFRLVDEALLSRVGAFNEVHPMRCDIESAAETYEELVRSAPPLDVIHLGLGPDGHTASLFPESRGLDAPTGRLVVLNTDPLGNNPHDRLTFTFEGIARGRRTIVTVAGDTKRAAFQRVLDGDRSAPATRIDGEDVIWLVDPMAMGTESDR